MPGLAHFLEHMLFYSSEKYPVEDEYSKFVVGLHLSSMQVVGFVLFREGQCGLLCEAKISPASFDTSHQSGIPSL